MLESSQILFPFHQVEMIRIIVILLLHSLYVSLIALASVLPDEQSLRNPPAQLYGPGNTTISMPNDVRHPSALREPHVYCDGGRFGSGLDYVICGLIISAMSDSRLSMIIGLREEPRSESFTWTLPYRWLSCT